MIIYVYPNLSTIKQRGNIDSRKIKADEINSHFQTNAFQVVEIPADFIKNSTEENKTGLSPCAMLDKTSVNKLYSRSNIQFPYILHTEPELGRSKCTKRTMPSLNWHDTDWVKRFINQLFSIIDFFGYTPYSIEIHPGKSQKGFNNHDSFLNAINIIFEVYSCRYKVSPKILIENRTGSFIKTGYDMQTFWNTLLHTSPNLKHHMGFVLDVQQLYTVSKKKFCEQLKVIPVESIKGFHIHTKHRNPTIEDQIPWKEVFTKIKNVESVQQKIILLPEVHHQNQLEQTYQFCKNYLG